MRSWLLVACIAAWGACRGAAEPERAATRRLTAEEWQNTVHDLLGVEVDASLLPVDELTAGFPNNVAGSLGEYDVENTLAAAEVVAIEATQDLPALLGCTPSRNCVESWAPGFLDRAWRRPSTPAEVSELLALYDLGADPAAGVRLAVTGALLSGSFLYRPEVRGTVLGGEVELDDFEVATRLSYLLWRSMPDDALFTAARAGELSTAREVASQARRMLEDPRAGRTMGSFTLDWLGMAHADLLDRLPNPEDAQITERLQLLDTPLEDWSGAQAFAEERHDGDDAVMVGESGHALYPLDLGPSFSIRGRMMARGETAAGLSFLVGPPEDPRFYRLERTPEATFALVSSDGAGCSDTTELEGASGDWVDFEIVGTVGNLQNEIQIRLWAYGDTPQARPSLACRDTSGGRPTRGSLGLWAAGPSEAWWAKLQLQTVRPVAFDFEPYVSSYLAETRGFMAEWLDRGGALQELVTADWTMANERIAEVYGISGVTGEELRSVALPPERVGLLTQPLFLSTFAKANQSSPVLRGMTVRGALLCEQLVPPPANVAVIAPDPAPNATTRERFARHTEDSGCAACHVRMDPIGFGFENFDQLGMYRTEENGLPIDASGEIVGGEAAGVFTDVHGMAELLADSDAVRACMVRHWYRYAMARLERDDGEVALSAALRACERKKCTVDEVVEAIVTSDGFRFRAAHEGDAP